MAPMSGYQACGISFGAYSSEQIHKLSVKRITNPVAFDTLLHPTTGGLYDPALGPIEQRDRCATCNLTGLHCPGHVGHIDLPLPVYHPLFFTQMFKLLRAMCLYEGCHRIKAPVVQIRKLVCQLKLLDCGLLLQAQELEGVLDGSLVTDESTSDEKKETPDDFVERCLTAIDSRFRQLVEEAGLDPDNLKPKVRAITTHITEYRGELADSFIKGCMAKKTCPHCKGVARSLSQENHIKIFAGPLQQKQVSKMESAGVIKRSVDAMDEDEDDDDAMNGNGSLVVDEAEEGEEDTDDSDDSDSDRDEIKETVTKRPKVHERKLLTKKQYWTPLQIQSHLEKFWAAETEVIDAIHGALLPASASKFVLERKSSVSTFLIPVIAVTPSRFRPPSIMGEKTFENATTMALGDILKDCVALHDLKSTKVEENNTAAHVARINDNWQKLQLHVNTYMDSTLDTNQNPNPGVRQALEKKEGLFRMHMMGKRVNYAARSVISPDPMIGAHEVGVPMVFALKLTYPEPVTAHNVHMLRQAVINGPNVHPGATHVMDERGQMHVLNPRNIASRTAVADHLMTKQDSESKTPKKVLRHIKNGDWVLMNRQPTLHKSSIMAHQVRVLTGERTLRLHYANCKSYNADFDGDEMNLHFPQSEFGRAEAAAIANTHQQYIALNGSPLRGLIQDFVVSSVTMTTRDTCYDREHYQQLVYGALRDRHDNSRIVLLPPAIVKPVARWTGKQVITTILKNLTKEFTVGLHMNSKSKLKNDWSKGNNGLEGEQDVIIRDSHLLCGVLDKDHIGASKFGLIHCCHEVYGGVVASEFLSALGRLFTTMLKYSTISLGIADILLTPEANATRATLREQALKLGQEVAADYVKQERVDDIVTLRANMATVFSDPAESIGLDSAMMSKANEHQSKIINGIFPFGLEKKFPKNMLQLIIQSGAKGSTVNGTQISCLLGQQALEGRRVPVMPSGKTLPSFPAFDPSLRAGGMVLDRFLTGLRPQEYYFHCMAGREGLIDTAVKTSRSGYLQRCLVKHLEDLRVHYDMTVRNADGGIVQFRYGEDGLDVTKTPHLTNFEFMENNYVALLDKFGAQDLTAAFPGKFAEKANKMHRKALKNPSKYDPVLARLRPDRYFGCVSEEFTNKIGKYLKNRKEDDVSDDRFTQLMNLKSLRSLAEPGEAVGVMAAQAVGEPSTQMTLNTFHFAGRSEANVTLGIPRLREVLMTASSKIKTPLMLAPIRPGKSNLKKARKLTRKLQRVTLADVLQSVSVTTTLLPPTQGKRLRQYVLKFEFIDEAERKSLYDLKARHLLHVLESGFFSKLVALAGKQSKANAERIMVALQNAGTAGADADDDNDEEPIAPPPPQPDSSAESEDSEEDDNGEDAGTLSSRAKSKRTEVSGYGNESDSDDNSDEEAAAAKRITKTKNKKPNPAMDVDSDDDADESDDEDDEDTDDKDPVFSADFDTPAEMAARKSAVISTVQNLTDYDYAQDGSWLQVTFRFSAATPKILFVGLVENIASKVVIRATEGIAKSAIIQKGGEDYIQVEGMNLREMWQHGDVLDINRLRANDVWAMMETYGVESARNTIIGQLNEVFGVYGITVNHRHLSLIGDYMTHRGGYSAMNRIGMKHNSAPFLKMSFETTVSFLKASILDGEYDTLASNSSRLVLGKPTINGTGCCSIIQNIQEH